MDVGPKETAPLFVYGNWAAYDELSDSVPLDEALAMRQLEHLLRLRKGGVRFDAYLMDAFWFAPDGAYRTWRKPSWPDGPDRWLAACAEHGLLPGLWFTANALFHLDLPTKWADSIDEKQWGLCLFKGGFLNDFLEVLDYWYGRGIRLFKFDFAELGAVPVADAGKIDPAEARARNVEALRGGLRRFREFHPEAVLMAYNGFEDRMCMDRSDYPPGRYVDPAWLEVFDSMYCGDPRPSDIPCPSFWRSVDVYSDCMVRLFESSGIPLDRIDNCGFMAGDTGTCYWRGKAAWKGMLLLSLARGGRIHVAYGDLGLFDDQDARFWAAAQELYGPAMVAGRTHSYGGWPGDGRTYGWYSATPRGTIATLVRPSYDRDDFPPERLEPGRDRRLLTCDPDVPARVPEETLFTLGMGQLAVFFSADSAPPGIVLDERLGLHEGIERRKTREGSASPLLMEVSPSSGPQGLILIVSQSDLAHDALRTYPGKEGELPFKISVIDGESQKELPPMIDRKIWSGLSWWWLEFTLPACPRERQLEIVSRFQGEHFLTATLAAVPREP